MKQALFPDELHLEIFNPANQTRTDQL